MYFLPQNLLIIEQILMITFFNVLILIWAPYFFIKDLTGIFWVIFINAYLIDLDHKN